ncbi:MAG: hypothetical protein HYU28_06875 [Actinobacteria bacterium]|nr:hypothetical protein [Actinomycetota bacterium]
MRRFIALTATAALALALAPISAARAQEPQPPNPNQNPLSITINKPAAGAVSGTIEVSVDIALSDATDSIRRYTVTLLNGSTEVGQFCTQTFPSPFGTPPDPELRKPSAAVRFQWNTERTPASGGDENCEGNGVLPSGGSLSKNGTYKIRVTAETWGAGGNEQQPGQGVNTDDESSGDLAVSNAPKAPTGVKLSYDKGKSTITIEWNKNTEPDVSKYRLQECIVDKSSKPCDEWKTLADVSSTAASVEATKPNIYRYRVAALRPNASNQTMVSEYASAKGDPTEIEVKEDPPETTTSQPQATAETVPPTPITVTKTVVQPTRRVQRAAPEVVQRIVEEEPGYESKLPYQESGEAIGGLPIDESGQGEGQRAILIPLAGGALLLVFAMQVHYLNRRAHAGLEPVPVDGEWDDDWDE